MELAPSDSAKSGRASYTIKKYQGYGYDKF